jgi:hypothetical protein
MDHITYLWTIMSRICDNTRFSEIDGYFIEIFVFLNLNCSCSLRTSLTLGYNRSARKLIMVIIWLVLTIWTILTFSCSRILILASSALFAILNLRLWQGHRFWISWIANLRCYPFIGYVSFIILAFRVLKDVVFTCAWQSFNAKLFSYGAWIWKLCC